MDTQMQQMIDRLKEQLVALSQDEIEQIVREARTEALAEAKAILKEQLMRSILEHALESPQVAGSFANGSA